MSQPGAFRTPRNVCEPSSRARGMRVLCEIDKCRFLLVSRDLVGLGCRRGVCYVVSGMGLGVL